MLTPVGVLCCGGRGTRLGRLTSVLNKHLCGIFDRQMLLYPLQTMVRCGIQHVRVVTSADHCGAIVELLGDGSEFGCRVSYSVQTKPGGIPSAIECAYDLIEGHRTLVCLGDNLLQSHEPVAKALKANLNASGNPAVIITKQVSNPCDYGVAVCDDNGHVSALIEKPDDPELSDEAVIGFYVLPPDAIQQIRQLHPSDRGETEITDLLGYYLKHGRLLKVSAGNTEWMDAGVDPENLLQCGIAARRWAKEEKE